MFRFTAQHLWGVFAAIILIGGTCQWTMKHTVSNEIAWVPKDTLTDFGWELLDKQEVTEVQIAHQIWLAAMPQIPTDTAFWHNLQATALELAGKHSLQGYFNTIQMLNDTSIKYLNLAHRNLFYLPDNIELYKNLRFLSVRNNRLQALSPRLAQCRKLRKLDLSSNYFYMVPFGVIYLSQVEELILKDNDLENLPAYFDNMSGLKVLDISNVHEKLATGFNNFEEFPMVLTKMYQLEKLFLDKLPLKSLPQEINKIKALNVLSLNGTTQLDLNQVFDVLSTQPNLMALDLSFLGRRTLPASISKLKKLKVLIWHEENSINVPFVEEQLQALLPHTKIFHSGKAEHTPFLRGNSIKTIKKAGY